MDLVLLALAALIAAATALPLLSHEAWWVRSLDFPRAQIFVFGVAVGAVLLLGGIDGPSEISAAALLAVAVAYQGWRIFPYTRFWKKEVGETDDPAAPQVSLLVANVLMSNREFDRLLAIVRKVAPDIFLALSRTKPGKRSSTPCWANFRTRCASRWTTGRVSEATSSPRYGPMPEMVRGRASPRYSSGMQNATRSSSAPSAVWRSHASMASAARSNSRRISSRSGCGTPSCPPSAQPCSRISSTTSSGSSSMRSR